MISIASLSAENFFYGAVAPICLGAIAGKVISKTDSSSEVSEESKFEKYWSRSGIVISTVLCLAGSGDDWLSIRLGAGLTTLFWAAIIPQLTPPKRVNYLALFAGILTGAMGAAIGVPKINFIALRLLSGVYLSYWASSIIEEVSDSGTLEEDDTLEEAEINPVQEV